MNGDSTAHRGATGQGGDGSERPEGTDDRLMEDFDGPLAEGDRPYVVCVRFEDPAATAAEKARVIDELLNGLDVRSVAPRPEEVVANDASVDLAFVDTVSPAAVRNALRERDDVAAVSVRELDPADLDVQVGVDDDGDDPAVEFERIRQQHDRGEEPDGGFDFVDPTECSFAADELGFDEVLERATDGAGVEGQPTPTPEDATADGRPTVVDAFLDELDGLDPGDERMETLREVLGTRETRRSTEVRVQHLQSRVDTLSAYADAMEEFIDGNGTARELLSETESAVDDLQERAAAMQTAIDEGETERASLDERLAAVEGSYASREAVTESVDEVREDVAAVEADQAAAVDRLESRISTLEDDLATSLDEMERRLDALEGNLSESICRLDRQLDGLETTIDDRLAGLEDEVATQRRWREEVSSAFAPADVEPAE